MEYEIMLFVNSLSVISIMLIIGYHLIGNNYIKQKLINTLGVKDEVNEYKQL